MRVNIIAEAIWLARAPFSGIQNRQWTGGYPADHTKAEYRRMAKAATTALHPALSTVEELEELPEGAIVHDVHSDVWQKQHDNLAELYGPWYPAGGEVPHTSDDVPLPVILLWRPTSGID